ncbi:MAG: hypothetical protein ABR915_21430, partial [Thermoguttaceae bacterium]
MTSPVSQQFARLAAKAEAALGQRAAGDRIRIQVGSATCEQAAGAGEVLDEFRKHLSASGRTDILLHQTGCTGRCSREPIVGVMIPGQMPVKYERVDRQAVHEIFTRHILAGAPVLERVLDGPVQQIAERELLLCGSEFFELYGDVAFFNRQSRIALRHNGVLDPESIEEYFHYRGFQALAKVLEKGDPKWVIDEIGRSKLRGRGGGGFPTGEKWAMAAAAPEKTRYLICNADEGDPGAFMDRSMLESDPLNVVEGMIIGGYAIAAHRGFFYVRAEYPMAIRRIQHAIDTCRQWGLLGRDILGSGFDFDLEIRLGAGAFVCGEETALIHSIEGQRGQPRIRPP